VWLLGASAFASQRLDPIDGSFGPGAKAPELIRSLKLAATCRDRVPRCVTVCHGLTWQCKAGRI